MAKLATLKAFPRRDKPRATAVMVAKAVTYALSHPDHQALLPLGTLPVQMEMLRPVSNPKLIEALGRNAPLRSLIQHFEDQVFPGLSLHFVLRKKRIEQWLREALGDGVEQVVILGAGFDTLGARIAAEFPQVNCVEVDNLGTQLKKRQANVKYPRNLNFVACDLSQTPLQTALLHTPAYHRFRRTFWIAEGILKHMPEDAVENVFTMVAEDCGPGSQVAFTFLDIGKNGKAAYPEQSFLADLYLSVRKVPLHWGVAPEFVDQFLLERQVRLLDLWHAHDLMIESLGRRGGVPFQGEYVALGDQILFR